jgi:hypothetical protein
MVVPISYLLRRGLKKVSRLPNCNLPGELPGYRLRKEGLKKSWKSLSKKIEIDFPLNINIYPTGHPHSIPMENVHKGKTKRESALINCIVKGINDHRSQLKTDGSPIWITIDDPLVSPYFNCMNLNPIPTNAYSRFYGKGNLYVNYEIDNVSYDDEDIAAAFEDLRKKKHKGTADILLVWADKHETMLKETGNRQ